jgi:multiple sugar transport system permease protein
MFEKVFAKRESGTKFKLMSNLSKSKISFYVGRIFLYLLLLDLSYVFLYPIINMIITSLKNAHDMIDVTVKWIPNQLAFENYKVALAVLDWDTGLKNSVAITALATLGHVLVASFIGYGFARYKFPGSNILFALVILNIIIPVQILIVPMFYEFTQLFKLMDTNIPIILPTFFGYGLRGGLYIFLFRQFYINLPKELEESAHIDGCGKLRTHFSIILPISGSVVLVTIVLSMVWHWNDHFESMVYLMSPGKKTLTYQIPFLFTELSRIQTAILKGELNTIPEVLRPIADRLLRDLSLDAILMASLSFCIFPILIVYAFLQKRFIQGIETAGIKG